MLSAASKTVKAMIALCLIMSLLLEASAGKQHS